MRSLRFSLFILAVSFYSFGQTYTISTFAGGGLPNGVSGKSASLGPPTGVAVDGSGNIYVAVQQQHVVFKMDTNGLLTVFAGTGGAGFSGDDGPATSAQLKFPVGVAVDTSGNLYIADEGNNRIRKVSNGIITTFAGSGSQFGDNCPATSAQLGLPVGVALDADGNLYTAEAASSRVRKVSNGVISTVAGTGITGFAGDNGMATAAQLSGPCGVAVDNSGNLYIADLGNNRIRKVSNGIITTFAGGGTGFEDNGPATSTQLTPYAVAVDATGNLYIGDTNNHRVRKVSNGVITTVAGNGLLFGDRTLGDNGPAINAQLDEPESTL